MKRHEWKRLAPLGLVVLLSLTACSTGAEVEKEDGMMERGRSVDGENPWTDEGLEPWDVWDPWDDGVTEDEMGNRLGDGLDDMGRDVKDGMEDVGRDVKDGMEDVGRDVKDGMDDVGRDVKDGMDDVGRDVKDGMDDLGRDGEDEWEEMKKEVGEGWDDMSERTGVSDWDGVLTEDGRMVVPEDGMLEGGIAGVDPAFTGVEYGGINYSGLSTGVEKENVPVAGWSEMVGHSRYRATKRGNVYDPARTEYQVKDLWEEARRTIDDMGEDFSRAVNDIGKGERGASV